MTDRAELYKEAVRALRHDARNLLNGIGIMIEHFERSPDGKSQQFAQYLEDKVTAMIRMGERADVIANIEKADMGVLEVEEMVEMAWSQIHTKRKKPKFDFGSLVMRGDEELSVLAIREVLDNALATGADVSVIAKQEIDCVSIMIADRGQGIPEPAMPMLLMPFRGAKRPGGTGLGLPIAVAAMEAQNGRVEIRSRDDEGTIVSLHFVKI